MTGIFDLCRPEVPTQLQMIPLNPTVDNTTVASKKNDEPHIVALIQNYFFQLFKDHCGLGHLDVSLKNTDAILKILEDKFLSALAKYFETGIDDVATLVETMATDPKNLINKAKSMGRALKADGDDLVKGLQCFPQIAFNLGEMIFSVIIPIPGISEILDVFDIKPSIGDIMAFIATVAHLAVGAVDDILHVFKLDASKGKESLHSYFGDSYIRAIAALFCSVTQIVVDTVAQMPSDDIDVPAQDGWKLVNGILSTFRKLAFYPNDLGTTTRKVIFWSSISWTILSTLFSLSPIGVPITALITKCVPCLDSLLKKTGGSGKGYSKKKLLLGILKVVIAIGEIVLYWTEEKDDQEDFKLYSTFICATINLGSGVARLNAGFTPPNPDVALGILIFQVGCGTAAVGYAYAAK